MLRVALRGLAVLIAVLGVIDPAITLERRIRQPLVIAVDDERPAALTSAARLQALLRDDYEVRVRQAAAIGRLPACGANEPCVLVAGDRWPGRAADRRARILGAIRVDSTTGARVAITRVASPATTHATAVGRLLVDLAGQGMTGQESTIDVFDDEVPVGRAVHRWTADGPVTIPIDWWPAATGPRRLSVRASATTARHADTSDQVDIGVEVNTTPDNVLVYDTRPSWTSTFVRRAIERDARLALRVVAGLGPRLQVTEGTPFRLDDSTLTDASAVIIGAADELSARDVDVLERFVRIRGGSLILVPDRRPTGPIVRLLPSPVTERLEPAPMQVGEWRASELLLFPNAGAELAILAKASDDAVLLATPAGAGRIVVSGAMDAWRYRDADADGFDRAWRSLVADVAEAGGRPLEVTLDRSVVRPAEEIRASVRLRAMAPSDATVAVGATITCGREQPRVLRLWPTGDRRRFEGRFTPSTPGQCQVSASSSAPIVATATASLLVSEDFHSSAISLKGSDPMGADATQGINILGPGDETSVARDVRQAMPAQMATADVRLMRSPWWIVPFAGCLGAEWWLRRRRGLR